MNFFKGLFTMSSKNHTGRVDFVIEAQSREDAGRGASRRLRRQGRIPSVIYGGGEEPKSITLDHNALINQSEHESFYSSILKIKIDGGLPQDVLLKDVQRHSFKPKLVHFDFQRVRSDVAIKVHVPLHFIGEEEAPGVKAGGMVNHMMSDLIVSCLPKNLPEFLTVDLSDLGMEQSLHLSDIKLPEGVEIASLMGEEKNDVPVVVIHALKAEKAEALGSVAASAVPATKVKAEAKVAGKSDAKKPEAKKDAKKK